MPDAILLQQADIGKWVKPYWMLRVSVSDKWVVVNINVSCLISEKQGVLISQQHLICSANVQHQCSGGCCTASGSVAIYQEQWVTTQTQAIIVHNMPGELMLNTAWMHDTSHFSWHHFPIDTTSLDFNLVIMNGAQQEINLCKQANVSGRGLLGRGWASTRGRGGSSNWNVSVLLWGTILSWKTRSIWGAPDHCAKLMVFHCPIHPHSRPYMSTIPWSKVWPYSFMLAVTLCTTPTPVYNHQFLFLIHRHHLPSSHASLLTRRMQVDHIKYYHSTYYC